VSPRPFEGIKVLDLTHVLAGPFAAYQLGVFGADVIKIEMPTDPDQTRYSGPDEALVDANMGAYYLTQGSNKRSLTLDLKTEKGRTILKKLVATADIFLENYRPGALDALGLGYADLAAINPKLIYASMSAFGQDGPRRTQTAYDQVIQASSGLMATSGTPDFNPLRQATPAIDYASGTTGAFALASALFQRERTGKGQRIDMAMLDVALVLMGTHLTGYLRNGWHPTPQGNRFEFATIGIYQTKAGQLMIAAINLRQQARLWTLLGRPDLIKKNNRERAADRDREGAVLTEIMLTKTADEWEAYFQENHVPVGRIRQLRDTLADPQLKTRDIVYRFEDGAPGVDGGFSVPVAAFKLEHGGARIDRPPPQFGEHNDEILGALGYSAKDIEALRADGVIGKRP
jgi:crotonobetainyl-CoA:carnitine CoA-transferase CaiB-like acyl-CoA transferase